ncbi:GIY-YIG nuclease family protein [Thioflexithrix psekupsensis]|uniref:GIY-YIG domain-containing protein n=1 Tax=Thioflexithrix psekupsensis TaxID=1570016 RepID=A0A251X956_9GAMM|nr:GIY-YIG nuclease family protein [Thioflexithrix psekupsensis]OUD14052.1 hypothetical protein TPSD3_06855 [Thioflexithrix psekupsensis]
MSKYIYIVDNEKIKIGFSETPWQDISDLEQQGGFKTVRAYVLQTDVADQVEPQIYHYFAHYHFIGEWFKGVTFEQVIYRINEFVIEAELHNLKNSRLQTDTRQANSAYRVIRKLIQRRQIRPTLPAVRNAIAVTSEQARAYLDRLCEEGILEKDSCQRYQVIDRRKPR